MLLNNDNNRGFPLVVERSAKVEYALLALMELATHKDPKHPLTVKEIAARQPIPERYLEQIFTSLRRGGMIQSLRGAKGGYALLQQPWQITMLDIVRLVEGTPSERENSNISSIERDLVEEIWQEADLRLQEALTGYTLQQLCQRRDAYKQKDPMYYI